MTQYWSSGFVSRASSIGDSPFSTVVIQLRKHPTDPRVTRVGIRDEGLLKVRIGQYRCRAEMFAELIEGILAFGGPDERCCLLRQSMKWACDLGKLPEETPVIACKPRKLLSLFLVVGTGQVATFAVLSWSVATPSWDMTWPRYRTSFRKKAHLDALRWSPD